MSHIQVQSIDGADEDPWRGELARLERRELDRRDQIALQLLDIADKALKAKLSPDDDLLARGLSVNRALRIISDYWRATGTELDVNIFFRCRSISEIAHAVDEDRAYSDEKLVTIREGDRDAPLFCYAGGANCFLEMRDMIAALPFLGAVYGLAVTARPFHPNVPPTVEREVRDAVAAIRRIQPRGPYRLLGFSFGGVLALEVARALEAEGEEIEFLGMLDSPLSDRSLSPSQWLGLMTRVITRQAATRLAALRRHRLRSPAAPLPGVEIASPGRKGHRVMLRFLSPVKPDFHLYNPQWTNGFPTRYSAMGGQIMRMKGLYRPRRYEGKTYFFTSCGGSPIDCPSRDVWTPYLGNAEWIEAPGTHLSMLVGRNGKALAADIGKRLGAMSITS
jgi:thioesterase domain-containing protein/aryl carrier-like protein